MPQQITKKIVLVSSGQPGGNPRLVKEALLLQKAGYEVTVVYCPLSPWADRYDEQLINDYPKIEWIAAGYHPEKKKWQYRFVRLRQKIYTQLSKLLPQHPIIALRSMVLYSQELEKEAVKHRADLYIGHNLGALPAVVTAAERHGGKVAFDFEDYHRGEDKKDSDHWRKTKLVEDGYAPRLTYATAASPLIAEVYKTHYPELQLHTINNCFPLDYRKTVEPPASPLKLFWFSQFVGPNRGLETVIEAMGRLNSTNVELTLLGNVSENNKQHFLDLGRQFGLELGQIIFLPPVPESEIVAIAGAHHIGLACEVPHVLNRELCLTNKIFMYLLAGNAIIFTKTNAQSRFLQENPGIGSCYQHDKPDELAMVLSAYSSNPERLKQHRNQSYQLGSNTLNFEQEGKKILEQVKQAIN